MGILGGIKKTEDIIAHIRDKTIHLRYVDKSHCYSPAYADCSINLDDYSGDVAVKNSWANEGANGFLNTYNIYSYEVTQQWAEFYICFTLPDDFHNWQANAIMVEYATDSSDTSETEIQLSVGKNAVDGVYSVTDLTSASPTAMDTEYITSTDLATGATTWAVGDVLILKIKVGVILNNYASLQRLIFYYN